MGLLDRFVGRLTRGQSTGPYALNEDDRKALGRQGLLQAGLSMLATPSNGMQGIARGLLAGVQGVQDGAGQLVNDRYRTDVMARTQAQMDANTAREEAMRRVLNPDFTINQDGLAAFAQRDPIEALRLRQQVEQANAPKTFRPKPTRTRIAGRQEIQEEFDEATGQWSQIGVGERWGNSGGGGGGGGYAMPKPPSGYRWAPDGTLAPIPGGPADPNRPGAPQVAGTEDERKASGWVDQALFASRSMANALDEDSNAANPSLLSRAVDTLVPFGFGDVAANALRDGPQQRFLHGAEQFAETALRAATGAGINESEAKQKIRELTPQVGDDEGTIRQKIAAQGMYLRSLEARAGRALTEDQRTRVDAVVGGGKPPAAPAGPRPGEVRNGYRFKGGNPADRNSWEKV
jgi:hypothetical protein